MEHEIRRRRTFAIISHPDAGKTTLTEKFLLYGGALDLAGSVSSKKNQRATASDWMELERQRGISVSSTVLQFGYRGWCVNLLDTPGHRDFSEDTYRVLTAVDSAVMVIDAGKGIETQTRKLFEVCRRRGVPIFTFINKLDRPSREPLALLDELEAVLGIRSYAVNWPIGNGDEFRGVYDRRSRKVHFFDRAPGMAFRAPVEVRDIADSSVMDTLGPDSARRVVEELGLLDAACPEFDRDAVLRGELTPVFFGSAVNNFGVELLLDSFLEMAPPPMPRAAGDRIVRPEDPGFSGFVFKIQANMDPKHRDRLAFVRVCSGRFERDMQVTHTRTGERIRLASSHRIFGRDRETIDVAWPGDVVGLVGSAGLHIGDTLADEPGLRFDAIPAFAPECFAWIHGTSSSQFKRFRKGLEQLLQEGVVQTFLLDEEAQRVPLLGAVGPLQFDVVQYRLQSEYGADSRLENAQWTTMRWIESGTPDRNTMPTGARIATDTMGRKVVLFTDAWTIKYFADRHPDVRLSDRPPGSVPDRVPASA